MAGTGSRGESLSFTTTLHPSSLQQEMVPEFPCTFFPPTLAPAPPRPPPGPATLAPPRPLIVPKAERLSPPALSGKQGFQRLGGLWGMERRGKDKGQWDPLPCVGLSVGLSVSAIGGERRLSGELNSMPGPGTLSVRVSPPQPILNRSRADNKVALPCHPKICLLTLGPTTLLPMLIPLSAFQD